MVACWLPWPCWPSAEACSAVAATSPPKCRAGQPWQTSAIRCRPARGRRRTRRLPGQPHLPWHVEPLDRHWTRRQSRRSSRLGLPHSVDLHTLEPVDNCPCASAWARATGSSLITGLPGHQPGRELHLPIRRAPQLTLHTGIPTRQAAGTRSEGPPRPGCRLGRERQG